MSRFGFLLNSPSEMVLLHGGLCVELGRHQACLIGAQNVA